MVARYFFVFHPLGTTVLQHNTQETLLHLDGSLVMKLVVDTIQLPVVIHGCSFASGSYECTIVGLW